MLMFVMSAEAAAMTGNGVRRLDMVEDEMMYDKSDDHILYDEQDPSQQNRLERDLGVGHPPLHHPGPVHHVPVHHAPVHHAPVHHAPVHHPAPLVHTPAPYAPPRPKPAPAYAPAHPHPVHSGPPRPYQYEYGVSDAYSGAQFTEAQAQDDKGVVVGSYSVALPDGRLQVVKYTADPYGGYVAQVSYEGTAVYPEVPAHPAPGYHRPAPPVYHPPAAPVYGHASEPEPVFVSAPETVEEVLPELPVYHSKIQPVAE